MSLYRGVWGTLMTCVFGASLVAGLVAVGWLPVLGIAGAFATLGASFGVAWPESERGVVAMAWSGARWAAVVGVMFIGLPVLLGGWSLVVLFALGVSTPALLELAVRTRPRRAGPDFSHASSLQVTDAWGLSDHELMARWQSTSARLQHPGCSPDRRLRLVQDRRLLLDEIERRDPAHFHLRLSRLGWQVPHVP